MATFELMDGYSQNAVIKVVGIGGAGGNAVQHMVKAGVEGVDFICVNTDAQALKRLNAKTTLQIGCNLTKGLGAGANPEVGRQAALEDRDRIQEVIEGADMLFITAGMGGGTGTGAAPVVAQVAKELGILTVAVVTKPFGFERRIKPALQGVEDLVKYVDSVITIPNDKLLEVLGRQVSFLDAFKAADDVLRGAVQGIADIITKPGLVNVDFADVRAVMSEMGMAMMGTGVATGPERAREAAEMAVNSPLLEDVNVAGARGLLVNITAGGDFTLGELEEVGKAIEEFAADEARVIIGTVIDTDMTRGELRVTVVATGLGRPHARQAQQPAAIKVVPASPEAKAVQGEGEAERPNYADLDKPTVIRKTAVGQSFKSQPGDEDYLDIPAFLRRQAD